jgi:hemerythrin-like domain-containing protein
MARAPEAMIFTAMEDCHRQILSHLTALEALVSGMESSPLDAADQKRIGAIEAFFSSTARHHHALEERYFFPPLLAGDDPNLIATVRGLQQDHGWIEENWIELSPQLSAVASGNNWFDLAELKHAVEVFAELCRLHLELEDTLVYPATRARLEDVAEATL